MTDMVRYGALWCAYCQKYYPASSIGCECEGATQERANRIHTEIMSAKPKSPMSLGEIMGKVPQVVGHAGRSVDVDVNRRLSIYVCECGWKTPVYYEAWKQTKEEHQKHVQEIQLGTV